MWLALLEENIQVFEDVRRDGTCQDAAITERPYTPLHPSLEPADELALCQRGCRAFDDLSVMQVVVRQLAVVERGLDLLERKFGSEER